MKTVLKLGLAIGVFLLLAPFLLIVIGNQLLHDSGIPEKARLIPAKNKQVILAFFPHPDDEITVAGTLHQLVSEGHAVHLVCLTRGESGNAFGKFDKEELAEIRSRELQKSADLIGVTLHLLKYPDSGLKDLGLDSLINIANHWINEFNPDILVSYDSKVGLYGHDDHRLTGQAMENLYLSRKNESNFSPSALYQVTLCSKQIEVALKLSEGFKRNYPKGKGEGLPIPDFSINTQKEFSTVLKAMYVHESQKEVLKDLMPYHDQVPVWIYSRVFGREYFRQVK
ncbi:MAG: putative LmbE-like protein [Algoriphagus marincola HL-49]|uniref:Putative LmbE-like protein n=1 Tax=Algoriphagus marincola HL-49 TaxID=1305737 RepID=A0A0P7ZN27_9BACT|nr:MAG: putative LmbE-like protein [Algoriphagus marincola HL-49]